MTNLESEQWQQNTGTSDRTVSIFGLLVRQSETPLAGDGGDNLMERVSPEFVWAVPKMRCCITCDPKQL